MASEQLPEIQIRKINTVSFYINENLFQEKADISYRIDHTLGFDEKKGLVNFRIQIYFHYESSPKEEVLAKIEVDNIFEIKELETFNKGNQYKLPIKTLVLLLGLAINHSRALMTQQLGPSRYRNFLLPIVDPWQVALSFFPDRDAEIKNILP